NPVIQKLTIKQLLLLGLHATVASGGKEALDVNSRNHFDLILMDCHLPDISGLETTQQIRMLEAGVADHIPIIAMTAGAMPGDQEKCISAGMDDYLSKPIGI